MKSSSEKQTRDFVRYLIRSRPTPAVAKLYKQAISSSGSIDKVDAKLLSYVDRHTWSIGLIDAGLPFLKPHSELRRRLYLMLAILEASPDYVDYFLPKKRSSIYLIYVGYSGIRAVIKAMLGIVLVKVVTR